MLKLHEKVLTALLEQSMLTEHDGLRKEMEEWYRRSKARLPCLLAGTLMLSDHVLLQQ